MNRRQQDKPNENFQGYCDYWGYRPNSQVGKLIDHLRGEHRIKYGTNYTLERVGKNRYAVRPGTSSGDLWRAEVLEHGAVFEVPLE